MRARTNVGSFGPSGSYTRLAGSQEALEENAAASMRFLRRAQAGVLVRGIVNHRSVGGLGEWGGGLGDIALAGRYEFGTAADVAPWPGVALLAGATFPTGTSTDEATRPLGTDATGAGTYDATAGVALEELVGNAFVWLDAWATHRFARTVTVPGGAAPVHQSFALRWTARLAGGYVFANQAAAALYANVMQEGKATIDGATDDTSGLRLTTVGAAGLVPVGAFWRLQGGLEWDVTLPSFGRNQAAGVGLSASLVRVWF